MASDTTATTGLSESKAKWTDNEKLALLISVINDTNPNPNWANVNLPLGRTLRASQTIFGQLKKDAAAHPMTEGAAMPAGKKRARKAASGNEGDDITSTPKKRGGGRKPKNANPATARSPIEDDEEEKPIKKVKVEAKEEDEDEEEEMDGVAALAA